jgi:hypothetical protein
MEYDVYSVSENSTRRIPKSREICESWPASKKPRTKLGIVRLECDFLPKYKVRRGLLGSFAEALTLLGTDDAAEANTFGVVVMQNFDSGTVEDGDDWAGEVRSKRQTCSTHAAKDYEEWGVHETTCYRETSILHASVEDGEALLAFI